jgi:hypothetical protein
MIQLADTEAMEELHRENDGMAVSLIFEPPRQARQLVPATTEELGDRNWRLPAPLDRWLPHVHRSSPLITDHRGGRDHGPGKTLVALKV